MARVLLMLILAAAHCAAQDRQLTYTFEPAVTPDRTVLHVTVGFQAGPSTEEEIEVPTEYAGETLHNIVNLRALSPGAVLHERMLRHAPNQKVVLAYDLVKDWTGPFNHPAQFHGAILPEYIEINGENALVHPAMRPADQVTVRFDWQRLPATWVVATSFGTADRKQSYSGPWNRVAQALFAAGEFRIHHFQIGTRPAILAIRDAWTFSDDEAIAALQQAIGAVREFWREHNFPYYLVTLKQFDHESGSGDGSQFTNAFWVYLSRQDQISNARWLIAHEAFHAWNPGRMGIIAPGEDASIEWFYEGFTRYYGYLIARRAGWTPLAEYLEGINRILRDAGHADNGDRGRLIALWLDREIRKESAGKSSLDDLMRQMVKASNKPLNNARILETAGRFVSPDAARRLARAIASGDPVPTAEDALAPCASGTMDEVPTFDLGFDLSASRAAGVVTAVAPDGPAFRAGLRDGQKMKGRLSVCYGEPDKTAIVTVLMGEERKSIEYYPRGKPITVLQYHPDPQACP